MGKEVVLQGQPTVPLLQAVTLTCQDARDQSETERDAITTAINGHQPSVQFGKTSSIIQVADTLSDIKEEAGQHDVEPVALAAARSWAF